MLLPPSLTALVVVLGVGATLLLLGRSDDVVTTSVTTAVVMVVAALGPQDQAWLQPPLRLIDITVGVLVEMAAAWLLRRLASARS